MSPAAGWGTAEPQPEAWRHGPWALSRRGDELADIAFDGGAVLRSIRAVVRDRDWRTVPPTVTAVSSTDDGLRLALRFEGLGADLAGELAVSVDGDGLVARLALRSGSAFERNRIGLVVLHGAAVAGAPLTVEHVDGTRSTGAFPDAISPHQPAMDVRALTWDAGGVHATLAFEGDVFEMEDQRNWTDASFKTYSTPLAAPMPVLVLDGDEIHQAIRLRGERVGDEPQPSGPGTIELRRREGRLPVCTLGATTEPGRPPRAPGCDLLVELDAAGRGWRDALARAADEAGGAALDVRIVTDRPEAVDDVAAELAELETRGVRIVRAGVFTRTGHRTAPDVWAALRDRAAAAGLAAALVGGTRAHFTELNREHADLPADLPALTFSSTPQMHAVESRQLVESIDMQRLTALQAVAIAAGRPVHVGPVTLRPRFNAVAASRAANAGEAGAAIDPEATDPRQSSAALAAWTVASAAAFAVPGVASVSHFEAAGPRGVRTMAGTDLPVAAATRHLLALSGAPALDAIGCPAGVHVLAGVLDGAAVALVANLRDEPADLTLAFDGEARSIVVPRLGLRRLEWPSPAR